MKERYKFGEISKEDLQEELALMEDADIYIRSILDKHRGIGLKPGQIPITRYWFIDEGYYIGTLGLRHKTTNKTRDTEGNIGYYIRPTKRNSGYGTEALRLGLLKAKNIGLKHVYINCSANNLASRRIIEKNGGTLRKQSECDKGILVHYQIELT